MVDVSLMKNEIETGESKYSENGNEEMLKSICKGNESGVTTIIYKVGRVREKKYWKGNPVEATNPVIPCSTIKMCSSAVTLHFHRLMYLRILKLTIP